MTAADHCESRGLSPMSCVIIAQESFCYFKGLYFGTSIRFLSFHSFSSYHLFRSRTDLFYVRNRALSITVILLGTMYYTWAKHVEGLQRSSGSSNDAIGMKERDLESQKKWGHGRSNSRLETVAEDESESDEDVLFDAEKNHGRRNN